METALERGTIMSDSTDPDERRERPCAKFSDLVLKHVNPDHVPFLTAMLKNEPLFTLRAQDISADLVVDYWIKVNLMIRDHVKQGYSLEEAAALARTFYFIPHYDGQVLADGKLNSAGEIAARMRQFTPRKLAD